MATVRANSGIVNETEIVFREKKKLVTEYQIEDVPSMLLHAVTCITRCDIGSGKCTLYFNMNESEDVLYEVINLASSISMKRCHEVIGFDPFK